MPFAGTGFLRPAATAPPWNWLPPRRLTPSYISRVLRLTLLVPDIVEAIVEGRQADSTEADVLLRRFRPIGASSEECCNNRSGQRAHVRHL